METVVPKISVVVANYNGSTFLCETLQAFSEQTFKDFELIFVDDGSIDNSLEIAKKWENKIPNLRIYATKHGGVNPARIFGLNEARGEYVVFFDSDDVPYCYYLEVLYKAITETKADLVFCGFQYLMEDGTTIVDEIPSSRYVSVDEFLICIFSLKDSERYGQRGGYFHNKIFRRVTVSQEDFVIGNNAAEDETFFVRWLTNNSKIYFTSSITYQYRQRENSLKKSEDFWVNFLSNRKNNIYINNLKGKESILCTAYFSLVMWCLSLFSVDKNLPLDSKELCLHVHYAWDLMLRNKVFSNLIFREIWLSRFIAIFFLKWPDTINFYRNLRIFSFILSFLKITSKIQHKFKIFYNKLG